METITSDRTSTNGQPRRATRTRIKEKQRTVLGITVVALMIAGLFFMPWRIEATDQLKWAPFYRNPATAVRSYASEGHDTSYRYEAGKVAFGILALEIIAIGVAGGIAFVLAGRDEERK